MLSGLPLGECTLTVSATGLEQKRVDNATLTVGETRTLDVELGVNRAAETVTVSASTVALDRDFAGTGGLISEEQVQNLPINGRNWAGLMILVPGADQYRERKPDEHPICRTRSGRQQNSLRRSGRHRHFAPV